MNPIDEQQIWRFIDGECSPEEAARMTKRIAEDPAFRAAVAERRALHQQLGKLPTEQPSLRFVRNVMEQLTPLYVPLHIRSLISTRQLKIWLSGAGILFALLISLPFWTPNASAGNSALDPIFEPMAAFWAQIPQQWLMIVGVLGLAFLILHALDYQLKKRFGTG